MLMAYTRGALWVKEGVPAMNPTVCLDGPDTPNIHSGYNQDADCSCAGRNDLPIEQLEAVQKKEGEVDRVYRLVKGWLIECKLPPGDFLSEVDLARMCRTSRTPVREACNRLTQEKWISRIPQKGYLVPSISIREVIETYEYRKVLECFTAEKAAQAAAPARFAYLRDVISIESNDDMGLTELSRANLAFHLGIAEIARNQRAFDQLKLVLDWVRRLDIFAGRREFGVVRHSDILSAIEGGQPLEATRAMAAHIDNAREQMLAVFSR